MEPTASIGDRLAEVLERARELYRKVDELHEAQPTLQHLTRLTDDLEEIRASVTELETRNRLLELIVNSRSPDQAIEHAARFFQQWADVDAVGIRLREGDDYPYFTAIGFSEDFLSSETLLCAVDQHGHRVRDKNGGLVLECMCGNVISGHFDPLKPFFTANGTFWTNSTSQLLQTANEADLQGPTRNRCHADGFETVVLIPLRNEHETFGLIQLNDHRQDHIDASEIPLLESLAGYVAAVLD